MGRFGLPVLFSVLTAAFIVIALSSATHSRWVITVASAVIALWMASFAVAAFRRMRR